MKKVIFKNNGTIQFNNGDEIMTFTNVSDLVNYLNEHGIMVMVEDCITEL